MILLDTNVLIDLDLYRFDDGEVYGASVLSRAELELGVRMARTPVAIAERVQTLNRLDARFHWLPFDLESARSYGLVAADASAHATGARIRGKDALIAAHAHRHGAAVMTANLDDFRPFERLVQVLAPVPR